jgi:hypothetical protein
MKFPKTTKELPFIEMVIDKKNKLTILPEPTNCLWNGTYSTNDGKIGTTCLPEDFNEALKRMCLKEKLLNLQEIKRLQKRNIVLETNYKNTHKSLNG